MGSMALTTVFDCKAMPSFSLKEVKQSMIAAEVLATGNILPSDSIFKGTPCDSKKAITSFGP